MSQPRFLLLLLSTVAAAPVAGQSTQLLTFSGGGTAAAFLVTTEPRKDGLELAFDGEPLALVRIACGQPRWKPEHEQLLSAPARDRWFRLGRNYWATIDNNRAIVFGDQRVASGLRYVGWGFDVAGRMALRLMEPADAHARGAYPPFGDRYPEGIEIALRHELVDEVVELLEVTLRTAGDGCEMTLQLAWGPHRWTAPVRFAEADEGGASTPLAAVHRFVAALDAMDSDAVQEELTEDASIYFPHADATRLVTGRDAIGDAMTQRFAQWRAAGGSAPLGVRDAATDFSVTELGPRSALVTWRVERASRPGRRTAVVVQRGGEWRVAHFHSSNIGG